MLITSHYICFLISANLEAIYDVWIVGDSFLQGIYSTLQKMQEQAKANLKMQPYIYEYYNIMAFWNSPTLQGLRVIARVLNSFIEALNKGCRLPWFLLVVLDKDIIEGVRSFNFGTAKEILDNIKWLVKQIDVMIDCKRLKITQLKLGAVYSTDPKIVLITMIRHPLQFPSNSQMEKVVSLRAKFNNALNEVALNAGHSILSIDACDSENHFDLLGNLNHYGQYTYWKQVNYLLENFDKKKVDLLLIHHRSSIVNHHSGSGDRSLHR